MQAKDWTGVAKDIVMETPLTPAPEPQPTREHRTRLTPDTIHAVMEQTEHRWLTVDEILSVAETHRIDTDTKSLKKVLHGLFMSGKLEHKQVGPQEWYRYIAVNWRLRNSIIVNMEKLQRLNDWNTATAIKDEMYDKYNLLTVEYVQENLDTLVETDARMLAKAINGRRRYHYQAEHTPTPEKPKAEKPKADPKELLARVDALLGVQS